MIIHPDIIFSVIVPAIIKILLCAYGFIGFFAWIFLVADFAVSIESKYHEWAWNNKLLQLHCILWSIVIVGFILFLCGVAILMVLIDIGLVEIT